uniref:Acetyltransferase, GNAT family n=1 Tax=Dechloromonas aromatica (strain RCB) TaxID=159087 RepID=Q47EX8_DECAR
MSDLRLLLASTDAEHCFAQELTKQNMEQLSKRHWGEWRSDVLSAHYPAWINFLISEGSEPIGYVGVEQKGEALSLHNLQIQDKYRNHGIGEWALREIAHQFPSCKSIEGSVFKDNRAVSFFKRQGFDVIGEDEHCLTIQKRT